MTCRKQNCEKPGVTSPSRPGRLTAPSPSKSSGPCGNSTQSCRLQNSLRILAGDPPIDWDHVNDKADLRKWIVRRDSHAADVVRREVLARGRKALLIYGNQHFPRFEVLANYDPADWQYQTLTGFIEKDGGRVFVIFAEGLALRSGRFQPDTKAWPAYAIAHVRGTVLGVADFGEFYPTETRYSARGRTTSSRFRATSGSPAGSKNRPTRS